MEQPTDQDAESLKLVGPTMNKHQHYSICLTAGRDMCSAMWGTKCVEPLFPDQFWSRHILLSACIHPHLSFWYYFRGFLSFSWVQGNSKEVLLTTENEHADLSPWQDYMHSKRRLVIYIVTPVYCGILLTRQELFYEQHPVHFLGPVQIGHRSKTTGTK